MIHLSSLLKKNPYFLSKFLQRFVLLSVNSEIFNSQPIKALNYCLAEKKTIISFSLRS